MAREYGNVEEPYMVRVLRERKEAAQAKLRAAEHAKEQDVWTLRTLMHYGATVQFEVLGVTYTAVGTDIPAAVAQAAEAKRVHESQQAADDAARRSLSWGT